MPHWECELGWEQGVVRILYVYALISQGQRVLSKSVVKTNTLQMPSTDIQFEKILDDCQMFHSFLLPRSPATKKDIATLPLNLLLILSLNPQSVKRAVQGSGALLWLR